jgi:hypothetical protein
VQVLPTSAYDGLKESISTLKSPIAVFNWRQVVMDSIQRATLFNPIQDPKSFVSLLDCSHFKLMVKTELTYLVPARQGVAIQDKERRIP